LKRNWLKARRQTGRPFSNLITGPKNGVHFSGETITLGGMQSRTFFLNRQPTLELNNDGKKIPIKDPSGSVLGTSGSPVASKIATLVYDIELGSWLMAGGRNQHREHGWFHEWRSS
jgi:hypothetical protein